MMHGRARTKFPERPKKSRCDKTHISIVSDFSGGDPPSWHGGIGSKSARVSDSSGSVPPGVNEINLQP